METICVARRWMFSWYAEVMACPITGANVANDWMATTGVAGGGVPGVPGTGTGNEPGGGVGPATSGRVVAGAGWVGSVVGGASVAGGPISMPGRLGMVSTGWPGIARL